MSPFTVDTNEVRQRADIVRNATRTSGDALGPARAVAASAEPGYPGSAAGPFRVMLERFAMFDASLERAGHSTVERLEDSADLYDRAEDVVEQIYDGLRGLIGR